MTKMNLSAMPSFAITDQPLSIDAVMQKVVRPQAGAVLLFAGTVRQFTNGKETVHLRYEAYDEMAVKMMEQIEKEAKKQWPDVQLAIHHRVGKLELCDLAVVIAVSAPHRAEAYEASRYAIERLKEIVPIWKKEHWTDGEEEWIYLGSDNPT